MRRNERALTGATAASLLGLDGFRDKQWTPYWAVPSTTRVKANELRVRQFRTVRIEGVEVADPAIVMRHLGCTLDQVKGRSRKADLIELALEHALRAGMVDFADLKAPGASTVGDEHLREVIARRGVHEPPTESHAETRAVQVLRGWGLTCWRQIPILARGRYVHRADFVIPFSLVRRPHAMTPRKGLILEVDSREFHERRWEEDHDRLSTYDRLGYHWIALTPNQIEHRRTLSRAAIEGALARSGHPMQTPR